MARRVVGIGTGGGGVAGVCSSAAGTELGVVAGSTPTVSAVGGGASSPARQPRASATTILSVDANWAIGEVRLTALPISCGDHDVSTMSPNYCVNHVPGCSIVTLELVRLLKPDRITAVDCTAAHDGGINTDIDLVVLRRRA